MFWIGVYVGYNIKGLKEANKMGLIYKDDKGNIGEPQTLTDLAQNTIAINRMSNRIWWLGLLFFGLVVFMILYIAWNDILTNSIMLLRGC